MSSPTLYGYPSVIPPSFHFLVLQGKIIGMFDLGSREFLYGPRSYDITAKDFELRISHGGALVFFPVVSRGALIQGLFGTWSWNSCTFPIMESFFGIGYEC